MDLDYMLNGKLTRQRHQDMIKQAQHERLIKIVQQSAQRSMIENKTEPERMTVISQLKRAMLTTVHPLVR